MQWEGQQADALKAASKWLKDPKAKQIFRLFGYAGTGKTTLAMELAGLCKGIVLFAAYTGKAALVLRSKGCEGASTIHSLIYKVIEDGDDHRFVLNKDSMVAMASLIIIDEVSMVDDELGADLLSFGTKILVLGDPAQLPPVRGTGYFTQAEPDIMLTEIHRQAKDNPIIHLSMLAREGRPIKPGDYGDSRVITRRQLGQRMVLESDQVLVGKNATRRTLNAKIRMLKGFDSPLPLPGDRLVCLRNDRDKGLLNGGLWNALERGRDARGIISLEAKSLDDPSIKNPVDLSIPIEFFQGTEGELDRKKRRAHDEFDFAEALTVHKGQGSQWNNVVVFDESYSFGEHRRNWRYTAFTRAAERLIAVV